MNRHAHILGLLSVAVASVGVVAGAALETTLISAGLLAVAAIATVLHERHQQRKPAAQGTATRESMLTTKRILMLMLAIGIVAYVGGSGTFATFSAETTNTGSSAAAGTLTMSDQVNTATACLSNSAASQDNYQSSCDVPLTLVNQAPGVFGGSTKITIANTGSLDASKFWVYAPYTNATLTSAINTNTTISGTSLAVSALEGNVASGDLIELDYGGRTQQMIAGANASPTKTAIPIAAAAVLTGTLSNGSPNVTGISSTSTIKAGMFVTGTGIPANTTVLSITSGTALTLSQNATASGAQSLTFTVKTDASNNWPVGTRVYDVSSNAAPAKTDCFDQITTTNPVVGAKVGTDLNFNGTDIGDGSHWDSTNKMCTTLLFWIQEQSQPTPAQTGTLTSGSASVSGLTDTSLLTPLMTVSGTGIPANTKISSITNGTTIVLSNNATASGSQSLTFTANYCWYGLGSANSSIPTANGMCYAPVGAAFSGNTTVTSSTTSLAFASALQGNIKSGDTVTISQTAKKIVTCTAGQDAYVGATSVTVSGCTSLASGWVPATGESFTTAATIVDSTINSSLSGDTTDTISNFDTSTSSTAKLELPPLTTNGGHVTNGAGVGTLELARHGNTGDTRVFYLGVFLPAASSGAQNSTQGLSSTFGISWHIDQ